MPGIMSEGSVEGSGPRYDARQETQSLLLDASGLEQVRGVSLH
jgi:hypothetical protein